MKKTAGRKDVGSYLDVKDDSTTVSDARGFSALVKEELDSDGTSVAMTADRWGHVKYDIKINKDIWLAPASCKRKGGAQLDKYLPKLVLAAKSGCVSSLETCEPQILCRVEELRLTVCQVAVPRGTRSKIGGKNGFPPSNAILAKCRADPRTGNALDQLGVSDVIRFNHKEDRASRAYCACAAKHTEPNILLFRILKDRVRYFPCC